MKGLKLGCRAAVLAAVATMVLSGSDAILPKPISSELPTYPERARKARVAGTVKLWFILNAEGVVTQAQAISGNPLLRGAALVAVKSWRFRPEDIRPNVRCETEFVYALNVRSEVGEPKLTVSMTDFRRVDVVSETYVETVE